ncbi:corticosteroid-binding globulin [Sarcophilus harrisii]|uniref:Corticosteroid-binding globulin n=1 Tax=Sarcophilus harrisii TaxID=9305 RepID=G3WB15_SARHA|nr:corticosteroid-binding globulin [Sarcophilus harrisii]
MTSTLYKSLFILSALSFCVSQTSNQDLHLPKPTDEEENSIYRKLAPVNVDFAFRIYKNLISRAPDRNIFISPVSISMSLAMLSLGARSTTRTQLLEGLGFNLTETSDLEIHQGFQNLIHLFNNSDTGLEMNMANALFLDSQLEFMETFMTEVKHYYSVEVFSTDFKNSTRAKKQVNDFVKNKTLGKVDQLFKELDRETMLILINYIFFKGSWAKPFNPNDTKMQKFYTSKNISVDVLMMFQSRSNKHLFDEELSCTVVQLEYSGNATAFFILPDEGKMDQVVAALKRDTLSRWSHLLQDRSVNLYIPKFCISEFYDLEDVLRDMGMTDVFTRQADLSGITKEASVKLSEVLHKAVLSIDEEGMEAAAGTALSIRVKSYRPVIKFDRPFLFVVFDHFTWSSLFLGKIVNPHTSAST